MNRLIVSDALAVDNLVNIRSINLVRKLSCQWIYSREHLDFVLSTITNVDAAESTFDTHPSSFPVFVSMSIPKLLVHLVGIPSSFHRDHQPWKACESISEIGTEVTGWFSRLECVLEVNWVRPFRLDSFWLAFWCWTWAGRDYDGDRWRLLPAVVLC